MATEDDGRRRIQVFQSLYRPHLMAGGERRLVILLVMLSIMTVVGGKMVTLSAWILAVAIMAIGMPILRMMAKSDPMMFSVYLAQNKYRSFYQARANVRAPIRPIKIKNAQGT